MKTNDILPNRQSHRLQNYDYSQRGLYFLTLCSQNRERLFGRIENHKNILNDAGVMVEKWYNELPNKYQNIKCLEHVVMPNHFHCIIHITNQQENTVGNIVRWFKTMTTNEYIRGVKKNGWQRFNKTLWQRDYYDIIIRNEDMYLKIAEYIKTNPERWNDDRFNEQEER